MNKKKLLSIVLSMVMSFAVILPGTSVAADESMGGSSMQKLNPWTQCGIGAMIFQKTQWAAVISNVIWDLGTTAVTSAGLSDHTCEGKDAMAAVFINKTYVSVEEETSKGEGEHLNALLAILGCDSASHASIIQSVRTDFTGLVGNATYSSKTVAEKAEAYYGVVQTHVNGQFAQQCRNIG